MANRGTTPNWDDEEIAKWGPDGFRDMLTRGHRARARREREEVARQHIDQVLALLAEPSEEDRKRAEYAIPEVAVTLRNLHLAMENWEEVEASRVYADWLARTKQSAPAYFSLPEEERQPFRHIVSVTIEALLIP